jgi:hypothetical protein
MPSSNLPLLVTFLAVIQEAELSKTYRLCLRARSRAFALRRRLRTAPNHTAQHLRARLRDLLRLLAAIQEAEARTLEHTATLRLWHLVGDISHVPHRQWLE